MNAVDLYVVYDDVNYIKQGWINRNRILVNGTPQFINLFLSGASSNKKINQIEVLGNDIKKRKILSKVSMNYSKAPYFHEVYPLVEKIIMNQEKNLAKYLFFHHQLLVILFLEKLYQII